MGAPNEADLIYAAGFIDGEGFIGTHSDKWHTAIIHVVNTKFEIINWLYSIFNVGTITIRTPSANNSKDQSEWRALGSDCRSILLLIRPYLKVKKLQAELCISLTEELSPGKKLTDNEIKRRLTLAIYLEKLNRRGRHTEPREMKYPKEI